MRYFRLPQCHFHFSYRYKKKNFLMSVTNNGVLTTVLARTASYPTHDSLGIASPIDLDPINRRRCSLTMASNSASEQDSTTSGLNVSSSGSTAQRSSSSWLQRCKQQITSLFKHLSKPIKKRGRIFFSLKVKNQV